MVLFPKLKLLHRHQQHDEMDSVLKNVFSIIIISQTLRRQTKSHLALTKLAQSNVFDFHLLHSQCLKTCPPQALLGT